MNSEEKAKFAFADAAANGAPWMLVTILNPDNTPWDRIQNPKMVISGSGINQEAMKIIIKQLHDEWGLADIQ